MRQTLRKLTKQAFKTYTSQDRCEWILEHPAQLSLSLSNVFWCQNIEAILSSTTTETQMKAFRSENVSQLAELTDLLSRKLTALQRRVVVALVTIDVHNRDIVSRLLEEGCSNVGDFTWQMQLRCGSARAGSLPAARWGAPIEVHPYGVHLSSGQTEYVTDHVTDDARALRGSTGDV